MFEKDHRKEESRSQEILTRQGMGEHDGEASSTDAGSSEDEDSLSGRKKVPKERFATDRFNGQSLKMKLQMNTNLSEIFQNFALSRFLRNNGDPDLLCFVLDHKFAPLEKTQFVKGVKTFLQQKQSLRAQPVLLRKILGLTIMLEDDLLYTFCTDGFSLVNMSTHEVDASKMMLAYCLPPTAFRYGTDDARTAFNITNHKNVPQWAAALQKLSEAVQNLGELFSALLKPVFTGLWEPIFAKIEALNLDSNSNRNTEFIAYELQYRLALFTQENHVLRTKTAWTTEIIGNLFWKHVIANFLTPGRNTELIQELQFRQQRGMNSALSLFPSALPAGGKPNVATGDKGTGVEKKVGTKGKKAESKKATPKASGTLYTEAEAIEKFGANPRTSSAAQPTGPSTSTTTHKKGTQYCRHFLLQQLGVQNTDTKERYTCARGSCRPGNHNLVTVDESSSKKSIAAFLALQISLDSFAGPKAEAAKKHLDAHIATLP
jgi:hypothetical protein